MSDESELLKKSVKELKYSLDVSFSTDETYIIVVAVNKNKDKNIINKLNCKKGLPIGGYVYDAKNDSYQIECADYLNLGNIPFSYFLSSKGNSCWKIRVPMTENIIKKFLSHVQKKELKNFKKQFNESEFDIQYIQMIDPN